MQSSRPNLVDPHTLWEERRIKLRGLLLGIVLVGLVVAVGSISYRLRLQANLGVVESEQLTRINQATRLISEEMSVLRNLTMALYNTVRFSGLLENPDDESLLKLSEYFAHYGTALPDIHQIRWLDQSGWERARVDFDANRHARVIPAQQLQDKSARYYFQTGMRHNAEHVYISPIDLNIEMGKVERPLRPTIRATYQTGVNDDLATGLLIINYDLRRVFRLLSNLSDNTHALRIANNEGYWLLHEDPSKAWGWLLQQPANRIDSEEPDIWRTLMHDNVTQDVYGSVTRDGIFWTIERHSSSPTAMPESGQTEAPLYLVSRTRDGVLGDLKLDVALPILTATILLLIAVLILVHREALLQLQKLRLNLRTKIDRNLLQASYSELEESYNKQRLLQEELIESRKLSALGLAVAGMAHEINTPAGGASITVDTLLHNMQDIAPQTGNDGFQQVIDNQVRGLQLVKKQLQKIVGLVKSYRRLATERSHEAPQRFSVQQLLGDLLTVTRPLLKHHKMQIEVTTEDSIEMTSVPGALSQALQNLIINAAEHAFENKAGEVLSIVVKPTGDNEIEFQISDNGRGVASERLGLLFDPFETTARGSGHSGLGLYMVHKWVTTVLKGNIHITSRPGVGTTFTLTLPRVIPNSTAETNVA